MKKEYNDLVIGVLIIVFFTAIGGLIDLHSEPETPKMVKCYDDRGNIINGVTCTEIYHSSYGILFLLLGVILAFVYASLEKNVFIGGNRK